LGGPGGGYIVRFEFLLPVLAEGRLELVHTGRGEDSFGHAGGHMVNEVRQSLTLAFREVAGGHLALPIGAPF